MASQEALWNRESASEVGRTWGLLCKPRLTEHGDCLTLEHLGLVAQLPRTREPPQENPPQMSHTTPGPHNWLITVRQE